MNLKPYRFISVLSKLPVSFWRHAGIVLILSFVFSFLLSLILLIPSAFAVEDGCWNKDSWGTNRQSKYFVNDAIIPNKWPLTVWTVKESMDSLYPNGYAARNTNVGPCAGYLCNRGNNNGGAYTIAEKANSAICQCTVNIANLCNNMEVFVVSDPTKRSGFSGSRMPDFPDPFYPVEWDQKFYYKGKYEGDLTTIKDFLLGKVPVVLKDSTTSITTCAGVEIVGEGDRSGYIGKYVINNIKTVKQQFSQWYSPWTWSQDFGVCGTKTWSWLEGRHMDAVQDSVTHVIPVEVLFADYEETITDAILGCPGGTLNPDGVTCSATFSAQSSSDCPSGYVFHWGAFGSSYCETSIQALAAYCTSGALLEDTSTDPYTYTCLDGSFTQPDLQTVNICGSEGKVAIPGTGDYDGSFTLEKNLNRENEVENEVIEEEIILNQEFIPSLPDKPTNGLSIPALPTGKTFSDEIRRIEGTHYGKGFEGDCVTAHTDVQYNRTSFEGVYPRGLIGNNCMGPTCLLKIVKCEFDKTKFGSFIQGFTTISGSKALPVFNIDLGSWGSDFSINLNDSEYKEVFSLLKKVLLLLCFVTGLRIISS